MSLTSSLLDLVFRSLEDKCPGPQWNSMCRTCCEYEQISCKCPSQGTKVGYAVPCCRNVLDECDPCILHQGKKEHNFLEVLNFGLPGNVIFNLSSSYYGFILHAHLCKIDMSFCILHFFIIYLCFPFAIFINFIYL